MKILLLDIETAPNKVYTWGLFNQDVALNQIEEPGYTLCFAAKWFGEKKIYWYSRQHHGRRKMLKAIYDLLCEADVVIHYNGIKFDIPTLNQEFMALGWAPPTPFQEIDILYTIKRKFRLTSNKLDFVLRFLGIPGKVQHKGMELWRECMEGLASSWRVMKRYNIGDITKLEALYMKIRPWIVNHPNFALYDPKGVPQCPTCGSTHLHRRGFQYTLTQMYQRFQCQDCKAWSRFRTTAVSKKNRKNVLKGI